MAWQEQIRKASFRGIEFYFNETATKLGRRTATHEYPLREVGYVEDLGRKQTVYSIKAYYIGDDWYEVRNRLRDACDKEKGSGKLVHPHFGELEVYCVGLTITESGNEGKSVKFDLEFVEAGVKREPLNVSSTKNETLENADSAELEIIADFAKLFTVVLYPNFVADNAQTNMDALIDQLAPLAGNITDSTESATSLNELNANKGDVNKLLDPTALATSIARFMKAVGTSGTGYSAMISLSDYSTTVPVDQSTPLQVQTSTNATAINRLLDGLVLINKSRAIATQDYSETGSDELTDLRTTMLDEYDAYLEDETNDTKFIELLAVKGATIRDINERLLVAPKLKTYEFATNLPSLLVAYKIYGDVDKTDNLVSRNRVSNPLFMPREVEALL